MHHLRLLCQKNAGHTWTEEPIDAPSTSGRACETTASAHTTQVSAAQSERMCVRSARSRDVGRASGTSGVTACNSSSLVLGMRLGGDGGRDGDCGLGGCAERRGAAVRDGARIMYPASSHASVNSVAASSGIGQIGCPPHHGALAAAARGGGARGPSGGRWQLEGERTRSERRECGGKEREEMDEDLPDRRSERVEEKGRGGAARR
eukprot:scaffold263691_cov36-Tisochrysis_lutea.AAC.1